MVSGATCARKFEDCVVSADRVGATDRIGKAGAWQAPEATGSVRRRRVLIVYRSYFPSHSHLGPASAIRNLVNSLAAHYDFHILTLNYEFATGERMFRDETHLERQGNVVIEYVPAGWRRIAVLISRLRQRFDVVDIHCAFDPLLAIPALVLCRMGLSASSQIRHTPHGIFMDVIMSVGSAKKRLFCRTADILGLFRQVVHLAGSDSEERDIRRRLKSPQDIAVVSQFIEQQKPPVACGKPRGRLRVAFIGRVALQKNLAFALDIMSRLSIPSTLDVFGQIENDAYGRECRQRAAEAGLCAVSFMGTVDKETLLSRLHQYDLLFHPTLGENFGHAIIEALSCGVPAMVSDQCPWTDLETKGAGWSFPLDEPARFEEVLQKIFEMGDEWSALSAAALQYVEKNFDANQTARKYIAAYG